MKFIAHRGYSKYELENTKEAFLAAANRSFFGIETDVTILKDGSWILFHDDTLSRLTKQTGNTRDLTYSDAMSLELTEKGTYHTYPYHIATPLEYLRICKHYNKCPVIELKWGFTTEAVDKMMEMLLEEDMFDKSMIICFTFDIVVYIKEKYPTYPIQFLLGMLYSEDLIDECLKKGISIDLRADLITKELVDKFHKKGLEVNAWTIDDASIAKHLEEIGIDYLTTNILEKI